MPYNIIRVPGQSSLVADQSDDILDIIPGAGISITTDAAIDAITITATSSGGGTTGYAGSVGFTGSRGSPGDLGYTGSIGIIGFAGSQGSVGFSGSAGEQGFTGSQGVAGISGNMGAQGYTGSVGDIGISGDVGYTGSQGDQGLIGFTGSQGELGNLGYTGSQGEIGITGFTGSLGDTGYTGSVGQGEIGYTGSSVGTTYVVSCSAEQGVVATGTAKIFRIPGNFTLNSVRASLSNAQVSGSVLTVDVNKNGVSVLGTLITIDNNEKTSVTATTPSVISVPNFLDDDEISIDVDQVGDGTAKGLKVTLIGVSS